MKIVNKSRKIISIAGEPLLPGKSMLLPEGVEKHPSVIDYLNRGVVADADTVTAPSSVSGGISDDERTRIAEEAVAKYKAEQEAQVKAMEALEAEIKAVENMKKAELVTKAMAMGIDAADGDTADVLKEKIIEALRA